MAVAILIDVLMAAPSRAEERTVTLRIGNMSCGACPYIVQEALSAVVGVSAVDVSFAAKTANVTFDDELTNVDALAATVTDAGFPAQPLAPTQ
ncbi:MAG: heavy-metal-associated domain-containing protein [Pseudomonadota bacterium]